MRQRAHPVLPESGEVFQRGLHAYHIPQQVRQATDRQTDCRTGDETQDRANQGLQGQERQGFRCFACAGRTVQCRFFIPRKESETKEIAYLCY